VLLPDYRFPIPAIAAWSQVTITQAVTLPLSPGGDFYHLLLEADSDDVLEEQNENNNLSETMIPIVITITLRPEAAGVLTSASGHITFQFPTGTVTTTTELCFIPLWPPALPPGPPRHIEAFRLTTCPGAQPVPPTLLMPVTVTWRYANADVVGMDEDRLYLYQWTESERWQRVSCPTERRWVDENRLRTCIQQLGEYVFGYTYEGYMPLIPFEEGVSGSAMYSPILPEVQKTQPSSQDLPGSPLRLPPWAVPPAPPILPIRVLHPLQARQARHQTLQPGVFESHGDDLVAPVGAALDHQPLAERRVSHPLPGAEL
jgi:hypothetical protein